MIPGRIRQWWPIISDAAEKYGLDPYLLAAVMDRESLGGHALEPTGPAGTGDNGHGRGLFQIDDRYHQDFIAQTTQDGTPLWTLPVYNIDYGAAYLAGLQKEFSLEGDAAWACAVAAYNAGPGRVHGVLNNLTQPSSYEVRLEAVDEVTAGGNYVSDVIERRRQFLVPEHIPSPPPPPKPKGVS